MTQTNEQIIRTLKNVRTGEIMTENGSYFPMEDLKHGDILEVIEQNMTNEQIKKTLEEILTEGKVYLSEATEKKILAFILSLRSTEMKEVVEVWAYPDEIKQESFVVTKKPDEYGQKVKLNLFSQSHLSDNTENK